MNDDRPSWDKFTAKEWALALQSLTPGGSEFLTPQECVAHVRQRMNYPRMVVELREALAAMLDAYAPRADWGHPALLHSAVRRAGELSGRAAARSEEPPRDGGENWHSGMRNGTEGA